MAVSVGRAATRVAQRTSTMMAFQEMLGRCPTQENRRRLISSAYANGALDDDEARLLMEAA